nr:MAG TPA: sensory box protein [Caudoviricetes sp.]
MEERTVNIMLNATAELNCKETDDIYIPIRSSEYRDLIRAFYEADAAREKAETRAINYGSESYRQGERIKELEAEIADLRQKLAEVKEAAE